MNAMNRVLTSFNPFMYSRVLYLHHTLDYIRKQDKVMPIQYILTKENIAYIATRSEISLSTLGPDALW